jgi:GDPmannose 4,6-dehydratase
MTKRALITGILGQDGAYLARHLLEQGYEVFGGFRRNASLDTWRMDKLGVSDDVRFLPLDLLEITNIARVIETVRPDELYNLAAQSFVSASFEQPILTTEVDAVGTARILECLRSAQPECRFYQASTSEMFGKVKEIPQSEATPFYPRSPYGAAKLYAHWITVNYREAFGLHTASGILFNHESPLRGAEFVTRKITMGLARIHHGRDEPIRLGNLDAKRDWGFAGDFVKPMARRRRSASISTGGGRRKAPRGSTAPRAGSWSRSIRSSIGRRRSTCSWAMPPRRARSSAGSPR